MTSDTPLPAHARTFVAQQLAALAPLPCRVDAMTAQHPGFFLLTSAVSAASALNVVKGTA